MIGCEVDKLRTNTMAYASEIVNGKTLIAESSQDDSCISNNIYDCLDYILEDCDNNRKYRPYRYLKICWDLDQFTSCIFRLLPVSTLKVLNENKRVNIGNEDRHYKLFYRQNKLLGITGRKREKGNIWIEGEVNLYGIKQYFPESYEPKTVMDVAEYGDELLWALSNMGILNPNKLTSPIAILQDSMLDHLRIPTYYDMPENGKGAADMAMGLINREWRACYKMGHWGDKLPAYVYDINAAYPFQVRQLPDTKACTYIRAEAPPNKYDWGLVSGRVWIDNPYTPILYDDGEREIPAVGSWEDVFTTELINWIYRHKCGKFQMKEGWFLKINSKNQPLGVIVDRIYNYRRSNELMDKIAKSMLVGMSGKFGEDLGEGGYGKLFNPIYRAMILTRCKIMDADFIWKHKLQPNLIAVIVDGLLTDKYVQVAGTNEMGAWRYKGGYKALVLGVGMQWYADKRPFGLSYDQVVNAMKAHPKSSHYEIKVKGQQTLTEVIKNNDIKTLGRMRDYDQSIDLITLEPDMMFKKQPKTGQQVLNKIYEGEAYEVKE